MAFNRSKVKATSVSAMKDADKQLKKQLGRGERADKIELESGTNLIRIYPPHPEEEGGGDLFAEPVVMTYLPAFVQEKDKDNNPLFLDKEKKNPKMKESVKPVFNAKVHGPQVLDEATGKMKCSIDIDLVEKYIFFVMNKATELYGKDIKNADRVSYLEPIFGNFAKKVNGITYSPKWIAYADHLDETTLAVKKFGDWEFKKSIHDRLQNIASIESSENPLGTDPFTDIDEGRGVKVLYNPDAELAKDYYTTEIDNSQVPIPGTKYKGTRMLPLSDAQLEAWSKMTPLAKRFRGSFGLKDLKLQITGLEMFDHKHKYGVFDSDEFRELIEAQSILFPEVEEAETVVDDLPFTEAEEVDETEEDQFSTMSRAELVGFNKKNSCGMRITASIADEKIIEFLRDWQKAQDEPEETVDEEPEETVPDEADDQGNGDINDIANGPKVDPSVGVYKNGDKTKTPKPEVKAAAKKSLEEMRKKTSGKK